MGYLQLAVFVMSKAVLVATTIPQNNESLKSSWSETAAEWTGEEPHGSQIPSAMSKLQCCFTGLSMIECHSITANICHLLLVLFLINIFAYQPRTALHFREKKCGKKFSSK